MLAKWMKRNAYAYFYGRGCNWWQRQAAKAWIVARMSPRALRAYLAAVAWAVITLLCVAQLFLTDDRGLILSGICAAAAGLYAGIVGDLLLMADLKSRGRSIEVDMFNRKWLGGE